jgi:hypothetical protein
VSCARSLLRAENAARRTEVPSGRFHGRGFRPRFEVNPAKSDQNRVNFAAPVRTAGQKRNG